MRMALASLRFSRYNMVAIEYCDGWTLFSTLLTNALARKLDWANPSNTRRYSTVPMKSLSFFSYVYQ